MTEDNKAHADEGLKKKPVAPKKNDKELTFLKKVQIVMGFDMDIEVGAIEDIDYKGQFRLGSHISGLNKTRILQFLEEEGVTPTVKGSAIYLSAEDYYKLEDKYHLPPGRKDMENLVRRLHVPDHSIEVSNGNSAFGFGYSRMLKLLRDHGIDGTCMLGTRKGGGDLSEPSFISLTDEGYQKFCENFPEILKVEAERKRVYDQQVAERTASYKA